MAHTFPVGSLMFLFISNPCTETLLIVFICFSADEEAIETLGYPLLGPSLIFILTVCSFNFANNLETLLALLLPLYCSEH